MSARDQKANRDQTPSPGWERARERATHIPTLVLAQLMPAIVLLLTAADPSPALANACSPGARRGVPVRVPRGPADLAMLPEACGAMEATFYLRGTLALALDDFYGSIEGALGVRGRLALSRRLWISFSVPALEARFAANATVEDARFDFGATSLAAHYGFDVGSRLRVAPYFRLLIPTETSFASGTRFGYELGVSGVARLARRLELVGGVLAASSFVVIGDRQTSVVTLGVVADWVWHAARWLTVAGGVAVRAVPGDTTWGQRGGAEGWFGGGGGAGRAAVVVGALVGGTGRGVAGGWARSDEWAGGGDGGAGDLGSIRGTCCFPGDRGANPTDYSPGRQTA